MRCGLLQLPELVAFAKFRGMQILPGKASKPDDFAQDSKEGKKKKAMQEKNSEKNGWQRLELKKTTTSSLVNSTERTVTSGESTVFEEAAADRDIPLFFRKYTEKYPFGNVHMSLRVGPLLIENGVAQ